MRLIFCLSLLIPLLVFSQSKKSEILTDTSMAVGIIGEDTYVGKSVGSYCLNGVDKYLTKGTTILISGIENCKKSYSNETTQFFEIVHNKKTYYIERDKLLTDKSYYEQIESMPPDKASAFREYAQSTSEILYKGNVRKALKFLDNCKANGLAVLDWNIYDESEYTDGTSVKFKVYNPTSKTIKYIWFTVVGFNPVGDKVIDRRKGTSSITVKAVGPIKTEESGSYEFTYVWFTDLVETARITSIKVQYMDNSIKTITNAKAVTMSDELYQILFEEE